MGLDLCLSIYFSYCSLSLWFTVEKNYMSVCCSILDADSSNSSKMALCVIIFHFPDQLFHEEFFSISTNTRSTPISYVTTVALVKMLIEMVELANYL